MNHIVKRFGEQTVLSDVTFEAKEREIFGPLGPSGAGKTTIINILTNQLDADGGMHEIDAASFETGLMLDEDGLYVRLNCIENLGAFINLYLTCGTRARLCFLTTHNMDEAVKLCDYVALLHKGIIVEQGVPSEICERYAAIFAGMALVTTTASVIAEDIERKSLRFLVMAGVKPHEYLTGIGGFILFAGSIVSVVFGLIGDFTGTEFAKFLTVMITSTAASVMLGATIGLLSKNQQAATALGMPIAMVLGFTPMIANFNETVAKIANVLYTQQLNVIVNDFSANFAKAMLVIGANMVIMLVLFVIAYKKKGLKI